MAQKNYQKPSEEENTDSNVEMDFLPVQKNHRISDEINGNKSRKILHLDAETIKVLKLMCEKYEKYYAWKK
jgi:hypothetical protein